MNPVQWTYTDGKLLNPVQSVIEDEGCQHEWETKTLLISSYHKCVKCGEER